MPRRAILLFLLAAGCARREMAREEREVDITLDQFQALRWLQGTWRGLGDSNVPFFESYVFLDDSTIRSYTYRDSTFAQASDSGLVEWRGGQARILGGDAVWVATRFDSAGVEFTPERGAGNRFRWSPESHGAWTATLEWPRGGGTGRLETYHMTRVGS